MKILLVGTGYMAREYAKVLENLRISFDVIGRSEENCRKFKLDFPQVNVFGGGLETFELKETYSHAIVSSSIESLSSHAKFLIEKGIKSILLEKPGGKNAAEINALADYSKKESATVLLAYNRRFYGSVRKAKEMIEDDGGVLSYNFEFTEWPHTIELLSIDKNVKENWFLANSTHVVDTAFYLGGQPQKLVCFTNDSLNWHSRSAIFSGAGIAVNGALFSYQANWKAPGRWSVEMLTRKHRLILRPMEILQVQKQASVDINVMDIDDKLDKDFKPGLYLQTKAFIENQHSRFCTLQQQKEMIEKYYLSMSGYKK